jgi:hypothetical protein
MYEQDSVPAGSSENPASLLTRVSLEPSNTR